MDLNLLPLGKVNGSFVVASETCAFDINKIEYIQRCGTW
jgi:glutamine phosphoribosylpyrophosphate amidotransferase